jgi:hypothetical protein
MAQEKELTSLLIVAYWTTPWICWLINAFVLKRRVSWTRLFMLTCIASYLVMMLVVACHLVHDALSRRGIDADIVIGESEVSDAGLALAPLLGIPLTLAWTAISFFILFIIDWSYRTDFRSLFRRNDQADRP